MTGLFAIFGQITRNEQDISPTTLDRCQKLIEKISMDIIKELTSRTWSWGYSDYLLDHAKNIMTIIPDREIASWNVFVGED